MSKVKYCLEFLERLRIAYPSLSSRVQTFKECILLLWTIIGWFPTYSLNEFAKQKGFDISLRFKSIYLSMQVESFTKQDRVDKLITEYMLTVGSIKTEIKDLYAIHFKIPYSGVNTGAFLSEKLVAFVDDLVVIQQELLNSNEQAKISVQNVRSYIDLTGHMAKMCMNEEALLRKIRLRARAVADYTALFLFWCWEEAAMDLDLKLTHLLQMTDPANKEASGFYLQIFNSLIPSEENPLANENEMHFIDHLLIHLNKLIIHCEDTSVFHLLLKDKLEKIHVLVLLVEDIASYSPMSMQIKSIRLSIYKLIIKFAITASPFSFANCSAENSGEEENLALLGALDESFNQIVAELVKPNFIGHILVHYKKKILHCKSRSHVHSLEGQLEKLSEYLILSKVIVSHPPLRSIFRKIILQKVIVKLVTTMTSVSDIDIEEGEAKAGGEGEAKAEGGKREPEVTGKEKNLEFPSYSDVTNLIDEYSHLVSEETKEFQDLHEDMKYQGNVEQVIGKYIDCLEEVQKEYLTSNKQASISVVNLRSFLHLSKVIVNCYKNGEMLNNLMLHLLVLVERTVMFLCSCWIEPETNHELKLSHLLHIGSIKNSKVQSIYLQGLKSLKQSEYSSTWPDELTVASFIDPLLLYLKELIQCQTRSIVASLKEQLENLHRYLTVLRNMVEVKDNVPSSPVQCMPSTMKSFHLLITKSVMTMATLSINDSEDVGKENLALLQDLEENISLMKQELRKSIIFDYPSVGGVFFSIFKNLEELLTSRTDLIAPMKHQLVMVFAGLLKLRSFMNKINDKPIEDKTQVKDLWRRIIEVSGQADFIIHSYVNRDCPTYYHALQISVVLEDIQLLVTEVKMVNHTDLSSYGKVEETYKQGSSQGSTPIITDIVVGFEDESQSILEGLIGMSKDRNIVSIVGMPGLGKTTIARKVYNHSSVAHYFQLRAWCCVSQSYQTRGLLLQILRSITEVNDDRIMNKSDEEIAGMLHKCLKKRKYLIILDDVWKTKAWEDLKRSLPDDKNGSRVIITTRDHSVAESLVQGTSYRHAHHLRQFHDNESYKLLEHKLFPGDGFPIELSDVGMMIAKNCKGLPLAVVLAAGILSRIEKKKGEWIKFGQSLSTNIVNESSKQLKTLIELSYTHLPDHLKCCFLYFGIFPEDKEISARKLAWLWIAEGFVRDSNPERLEDIAEHYLMDLIGRSLVIGSKRASRLGIKSCHVHDLLRDFCLAKAEEENFLQVVRGYDKILPAEVGGLDYGVDSWHSQDPSKMTHMQYRLSIYSKRKQFIMAKPSGPNVRTLFFHALADMHQNYPYDASFISRYFKLIKVLDLGSINIGHSLTAVVLMLHLRYLAVKGDIESIPTSIEKLWKLETFILRGSRVAVISVPSSIWSLLRLRHLHIDDHTSLNLDTKGIADSIILDDMESFSTPTISYGDEVEDMLRRLPNLRKLKCIFSDSWDHYKKCNQFPMLEFLNQLESLKVSCNYKSFHSSNRYPCRFSFPSNLTKLTLSEFALPWSEISAIGRLPNLIILKLLSRSFMGKRWDMMEGEFLSLRVLKLESLDLEEWNATNEHIPCLQRLMFSKCKKLKEIPSELGDIDTLEIIEVRWCSRSAANSARTIQETEEENGNDTLKVHIYPNDQNSGTSS